MIDVIKQQVSKELSLQENLNRVREFLQIVILKIMYDKNFLNNLAFVGGTALRIIFDLRRFSEDLDFSLINKKGYEFSDFNSALISEITLYGLKVESKVDSDKNVQSIMLKFPELLKAAGLSNLSSQKLSIKIEVDSNPPAGWNIENRLVNKTYIFNVTYFDLASSFATKLHACFYRKFLKGRDFYDFIWYMSKWVKPNYLLLNNAIKQTQGKDLGISEHNFKGFLLENIVKVDFEQAKKDVERFLEDKSELKLFDLKAIQSSIESIY